MHKTLAQDACLQLVVCLLNRHSFLLKNDTLVQLTSALVQSQNRAQQKHLYTYISSEQNPMCVHGSVTLVAHVKVLTRLNLCAGIDLGHLERAVGELGHADFS
jgi:hypothetical protein